MIRRLERNYRPVGVVIDTDIEQSNPLCSTCAALGIMSRLKQKIDLDKNGKLLPPGPDADNFLMCWKCGLIPTREAMLQGKISAIPGVSPVENPNDISKGKILGIDTRLKTRMRNLKRRQSKHEDKEVQAELDRGNIVTQYKTSMPT